MTFDVERARSDTPGCEHVVHLNNAGSSLPPTPTLEAVVSHIRLEARIGGYEAHEQNAGAIDRFYGAVAELIGAEPEEIAFCSSATRAWDMAFYAFAFRRGDRILTTVADYISNYLAYLQTSQRTGVEVVIVPNDEHGQASVEALRQLVDERVKLIAITHVPTNTVVACQTERSQHANRDRAMKMLAAKLYELEIQKRNAEKDALEATKSDIGWGSQIRNYVLDQSRIKDLRTGIERSDTQKVLDGDLDEFIEASLKSGLEAGSKRSDAA